MRKQIFILCLMGCFGDIYANTAQIGAYVIDAVTQKPVPGIKVSASFSNDNGWKAWTESAPIYHDEQFTDENGFCELKGKTNIGKCGCGVDRQGAEYYAAAGRGFQFSSKNMFGIWQPENLVATIRLQRVEHPIPLYVRNVRLRDYKHGIGGFDGTNTVLRYDLVAGDWLPPCGHGERADMIIKTHFAGTGVWADKCQSMVFFDFTNRVEFIGEGNGIYERIFENTSTGIRFRNAVESGYEGAKTLNFGRRKSVSGAAVYSKWYTDSNDHRCYCFRIRTKFNENGELQEAYYGKIHGDFKFEGNIGVGLKAVEFLYYLNPTPLDRNLEWDMKNNLCPNPGSLGQLQP